MTNGKGKKIWTKKIKKAAHCIVSYERMCLASDRASLFQELLAELKMIRMAENGVKQRGEEWSRL